MLNRTWSLFFPLALLGAVTLLLGFMLTVKEIKVLYSEDNLIESATVLGYGLALLILLATTRVAWRFRLLGAVVLLLCAARELDAHKAFTAESFLKISYYLRNDDPLWQRVLAGLALLAIALVLIRLLADLPRLLEALGDGRPAAFSLLAAILVLPLAKLLDSGPRMVHKFHGYDLPAEPRLWFLMAEETLEFAAPLLFILALAQQRTDRWR